MDEWVAVVNHFYDRGLTHLILKQQEQIVMKSLVDQHARNTGEIPDGCSVAAEKQRFFIK